MRHHGIIRQTYPYTNVNMNFSIEHMTSLISVIKEIVENRISPGSSLFISQTSGLSKCVSGQFNQILHPVQGVPTSCRKGVLSKYMSTPYILYNIEKYGVLS